MIGAVVAFVADSVTVSVWLIQISVFVFDIRIVSVFAFYIRAVIEIIWNLIVVFIGNTWIAGKRILVSVGVIGAVVTYVTDSVTVSVRLVEISVFVFDIRIICVFAFYVRAVIEIIWNLIVVFIGNTRIAGHRILVSVGVIGAVVAGITDSVTVSVWLVEISVFVFDIRVLADRISILICNN